VLEVKLTGRRGRMTNGSSQNVLRPKKLRPTLSLSRKPSEMEPLWPLNVTSHRGHISTHWYFAFGAIRIFSV